MLITHDQQTQYAEAQIAQLRHEDGLDRNVVVRYFAWIGGVFKGGLGKSILCHTPVRDEIVKRLPTTLHIGLLGWIIGTVLGVAPAYHGWCFTA
jgi:peptide/nickel transport system permease protein